MLRETFRYFSDINLITYIALFFSCSSIVVGILSESLKLVVEYYHSGGRSGRSLASHMIHDREKTQALVDAGYKVVRIRENGLTHLGMNTDKVLELDYQYGSSMVKIVKEVMEL